MAAPLRIDGNLEITSSGMLVAGIGSFHRAIFLKGNWTNNGNFVEREGTVIFNGTGTQTINAGATETFYRLQLAQPGGGGNNVDIAINIRIERELILDDGVLLGSGGQVRLLDGATVGGSPGDNSYVDATIRRVGTAPFTFPLGSAGRYRPATVDGFAGTQTLLGSFVIGDPGNTTQLATGLDGVLDCEYWRLRATNALPNTTVTLTWDDVTCDVNPATMGVSRFLSGTWEDLGSNNTVINGAEGSVDSDPLTLASNFVSYTLYYTPLPDVCINTEQVNATLYDVTGPGFSQTGIASGGEDYFTPVAPFAGQDVNIAIQAGADNTALNLRFTLDAGVNVTNPMVELNGVWEHLAAEYYTIDGSCITYTTGGPPAAPASPITTNLNGLVYALSGPDFEIFGFDDFPSATLNIFTSAGTPVRQNLDPLVWDGTDNGGLQVAQGVYRFSVDVTDANGISETFDGQMIVQ